MNLYIASPDSKDAGLVAARLMDQNVSTEDEAKDTNVFAVYVNGCQIDSQTGAWKSSKASQQRMEEMETDVLPDYPDDANDNDGHWGNTAKKSRMSSYEPSSASLQSVQSSSKSIGPGTSQIYTGNFGSMNSEERKYFSLNIFMMPWQTNVSSVVHRLFLITTGICVVVINTETCRLKDYKESFLKMLDSLWAFSRGDDIRFPKVIVAATTFSKDIPMNTSANIASLFSSWIIGKPYEYQCKEHFDHVFILSDFLKSDQTRELKAFIFRLLKKTEVTEAEFDYLTEEINALRKTNKKIVEKKALEMKHMNSDAVEKSLMQMHGKKEIIYLHRMTPKWIVLDPEFLVLSLNKILQRACDDNQITFFKEMDLKNIIRSSDEAPLIDIMCNVGILAKAVHCFRNDNIFVISTCQKAPNQLENLRHLPNQDDCPHIHSPILCLNFTEPTLVPCAFQMITCHLLQRFPYDMQGRRILIYNNFAAFKLSRNTHEKQRLCLFTEGRYLFIYVIRYTKGKEEIDSKLCGQVRNIVEDTLTEGFDADITKCVINACCKRTNNSVKNGRRQIEFEYMIRCPATKDIKINEEGLISVPDLKNVTDTETLEEKKLYHCCNHSDKAHPHEVNAELLLKTWFPEEFKSGDQDYGKTETSAAKPTSMFDLSQQESAIKLDTKLAGKVADCIGQRWQLLAFELNVDQPTLDKIIENNPRNTEKAITDMLMHSVNIRQGELTLKEVEECMKRVSVSVNWEKFNKLYHQQTST